MLKIEVDNTGHFETVAASGPVPIVAALFGAAINAVYCYISAGHPDAGAAFRESIEAVMASGEIWDPEITKNVGNGYTIVEFEDTETQD